MKFREQFFLKFCYSLVIIMFKVREIFIMNQWQLRIIDNWPIKDQETFNSSNPSHIVGVSLQLEGGEREKLLQRWFMWSRLPESCMTCTQLNLKQLKWKIFIWFIQKYLACKISIESYNLGNYWRIHGEILRFTASQ